MRRFELVEGTASKFWEIEQVGCDLNICWGRIGTAGQRQTKSFDTDAKAQAALTKLVSEKTGKGYQPTGVVADASMGKAPARPPQTKPEAAQKTEAPPKAPPEARFEAKLLGQHAAVPVAAGSAPWLTQGEPVRLTPQMRSIAYASRRFPRPIQLTSPAAAWLLVKKETQRSFDLNATDAALRSAAQRVLDRLQLIEPPADAEADTLLLGLALHTNGHHGTNEPSGAIVDYLVARYGLLVWMPPGYR